MPSNAQVKIDSLGNIVAVWEEDQATGAVIQAANYDASTLTWSTPQQISPIAIEYSGDPKLAINSSGEAVAIWQSIDSVNNINTIYAATIGLQTSPPTWSTSTALSTTNESVDMTSMKVEVSDSHSAVVTWISDVMTPVHNLAFFATTTTDGGLLKNSWNTPTAISGP